MMVVYYVLDCQSDKDYGVKTTQGSFIPRIGDEVTLAKPEYETLIATSGNNKPELYRFVTDCHYSRVFTKEADFDEEVIVKLSRFKPMLR